MILTQLKHKKRLYSGDSYIGSRNNWNAGDDYTNTDVHLADILETFEDGQDEDFSEELSEGE